MDTLFEIPPANPKPETRPLPRKGYEWVKGMFYDEWHRLPKPKRRRKVAPIYEHRVGMFWTDVIRIKQQK